MDDEDQALVYWVLALADGRRGADHDEVLRAGRRLRDRGGGDVPLDPAGRRGPAHAVLRALPGRGRRLARDGRGARRAGARRRSPPRSGRSSTSRWSRRTSGSSPSPSDLAAKVRFVTIYHLILESTLGLTTFRFVTEYLDGEGLLPGIRRGLLEDPPRRDPPHRLRRLVPARDGPRATPARPTTVRETLQRAAALGGRGARRVGRRRPRHRAPRRRAPTRSVSSRSTD